MCRFLAYSGPPVLAEDLLYKPRFSLIVAQSMQAEEMSVAVNGDGFGIAWYQPELDNEPCVFRSIKPAWSDMNLKNLSKKIYSPLFFAHVRAASPGSSVEEVNSHPFQCGRLAFMHNGMVGEFNKIRRPLLRRLNDVAYEAILGSTDSEHMFGLFLNHIEDPFGDISTDELVYAMHKMLDDYCELYVECGLTKHSYLNFCVTNGKAIVATRYTTNPLVQPSTLYYMYGSRYHCEHGECRMESCGTSRPESVIIASEPFTTRRSDWMKVERNVMMIVDDHKNIRFQSIRLPIEDLEQEPAYTP
ncbi:MAG: class II glutamine amidotransferase [Bacteroidota bacterium]|nr:class II glutamine amidotransferase [Candidatus Kapabacteria bacterium]MDW8219576.1 class II glutamine amidotransferase [Bacteroidota bacterium]